MSKVFAITRAAREKVAAAQKGVMVLTDQQKAVRNNVTTKRYTLFDRNKPVINWNSIAILRQWMADLGHSGMGTFIHYNETGVSVYSAGSEK